MSAPTAAAREPGDAASAQLGGSAVMALGYRPEVLEDLVVAVAAQRAHHRPGGETA